MDTQEFQMNGAKSKRKGSSRKPKRYVCICKVGNNPDGSARCIKHRLDNLLSYVKFLDREHPTWRWFNVYANRGSNKGEQLGSFTVNRRPESKKIAS